MHVLVCLHHKAQTLVLALWFLPNHPQLYGQPQILMSPGAKIMLGPNELEVFLWLAHVKQKPDQPFSPSLW